MQAAPSPRMLGILTKFWNPGRAKTRLGASIGMNSAAALHRLFVIHLCEQLASSGDRRAVCLDPPEQITSVQDALESAGIGQHWQMSGQVTGPLGQRMQRWFATQLMAQPSGAAILIGADCPTLGPAEIELAFQLLTENQAVIGPACDGGYVLLGLRGPWQPGELGHALLFGEIPWSTQDVLKITRQRLRQADLSWAELPTMADVDTASDLERLRERLKSNDPSGLSGKIDRAVSGTQRNRSIGELRP
jgi:rSAM/selenodomain-associated transferase 1